MSLRNVSLLLLAFIVMVGCAPEKPAEPAAKPQPPAQKREEIKGNIAVPSEPA